MNAAERILLTLDAQECWTPRVRRPQVEPVVTGIGAADFGWSGSDLKDAIVNWQKRMSDLAANYAKLSSAWSAQDPAKFTDWTNDWNVLQARYVPALAAAQAVANSTFGMGTDAAYDALAKAMRVSYPPDGGPVSKGDYDDLYSRLATASRAVGTAPLIATPMTQPTGTDWGMGFYKATAPLDIIAQLTGAEKPKVPGVDPLANFLAWIIKHRTAIVITAGVTVGGVLLLQLMPVLMMPVKAAKGIAALAA